MLNKTWMVPGILLLILSWLPLAISEVFFSGIHYVGLGMWGFTMSVFAVCLMGMAFVKHDDDVEWDPL